MRIYVYAALALAVLGGVYYVHRLQTTNASLHARANIAESSLTALQAAYAHEREIAHAASQQFESTVTSLQVDLARRPLKPVVIRVPVAAVPSANSSAGAASGADEAAEGREPRTTEKDIGPDLTEYALDCQINTLQLESLQGWVRSR